jgi:hypothetical protein
MLMELVTDLILPVLLVGLVASYCTSVVCRLARWRHRNVNWALGFLGAFAAALVSFSFMLLGTSLQPGEFPYFADFVKWMLFVSIGGSLFALIPCELVVRFFRRTFRA